MPGASCGAPSPGSGRVDISSWDAQRLRRWVGTAKRPRPCPYSDVVAIRPPMVSRESSKYWLSSCRMRGLSPSCWNSWLSAKSCRMWTASAWPEVLCGTGAPRWPTAGSPARRAGCAGSARRPPAAQGPGSRSALTGGLGSPRHLCAAGQARCPQRALTQGVRCPLRAPGVP